MKKSLTLLFILCFLLFLIMNYYYEWKIPLINKIPFFLFQIQTGSMMPEIQAGEIVGIVKKQEYQENEIITYICDNSYFVTHRIVKKTTDGYITKGDSNNTEDEKTVKTEQIQGKVIFHSKLLGKMYKYRYFIIILCIFLFIL